MKRHTLLFLFLFLFACGQAQKILPPDKLYGDLFTDVQLSHIFPDSKTFADAIPKKDPAAIVEDYHKIKNNPNLRFSLRLFVEANFTLPDTVTSTYSSRGENIEEHINRLWSFLKRTPETSASCADSNWWCQGSLLPLPQPYVVPGGRFREVYYWDSYFTMLGLKESGEYELIEHMINNFAYLIQHYGHIPNGNRTYYLSRSQPPYFSLMIELLAGIKGKEVYAIYEPALEKEYDYWMDKSAPTEHVVHMPDGSVLNRYYDQDMVPRQEAYAEDYKTAKELYPEGKTHLYRELRSAAESGWDFSSRWLKDQQHLASIRTTSIIPVDLNCLLYHLEQSLATACDVTGNKLRAAYYRHLALKRKTAINKYCWSAKNKWYVDYVPGTRSASPSLTLAGMSVFFLELAPASRMAPARQTLEKLFLKPGGLVTTTKRTGQQWDAPNGWPPLQWIAIQGLEHYQQKALAQKIAERWVALNKKVFTATGKLMEKYNVIDMNLEGGGGEYPSQDGFGWTNGVLLALMKQYNLR